MKKILLILTVLAVSLFAKININTASVEELSSIKGIGTKKAEAIVKYRKSHGKFKNYDDLENVKGIGPALVDNIKKDIKNGEKTAKKSTKKSTKSTSSKSSKKASAKKQTKKTDKKSSKKKKKIKTTKSKKDSK